MPTVTELSVDLAAICHNLQLVQERAPESLILAAVKANAYGHGIVEVSRALSETGAADWLGIAAISEGQQLRAAGIELPILKLTPTFEPEVAEALNAGVTLTVGSAAAITETQAVASQLGKTDVKVHLEVDTGMRRVGAEPEAALSLARLIHDSPNLQFEGLLTHHPISDSPAGDEFTRAQLTTLRSLRAEIEAALGPIPLVHAANSGAILGHDLAGTNLVRPGIMCYGSYPDPNCAQPVELRPVVRWSSRVAFLKPIRAGESVGYSRTWRAPRDTWIATVGVGYGDGYSRLLSNRGRMLISGESYPIVGNVCMDQTMIDVGPEPKVQLGDEVVLIGRSQNQEITVAEIAELMGTITYEVTCLITPRVPRSYLPAIPAPPAPPSRF